MARTILSCGETCDAIQGTRSRVAAHINRVEQLSILNAGALASALTCCRASISACIGTDGTPNFSANVSYERHTCGMIEASRVREMALAHLISDDGLRRAFTEFCA